MIGVLDVPEAEIAAGTVVVVVAEQGLVVVVVDEPVVSDVLVVLVVLVVSGSVVFVAAVSWMEIVVVDVLVVVEVLVVLVDGLELVDVLVVLVDGLVVVGSSCWPDRRWWRSWSMSDRSRWLTRRWSRWSKWSRSTPRRRPPVRRQPHRGVRGTAGWSVRTALWLVPPVELLCAASARPLHSAGRARRGTGSSCRDVAFAMVTIAVDGDRSDTQG